jgi:hypothetical protein
MIMFQFYFNDNYIITGMYFARYPIFLQSLIYFHMPLNVFLLDEIGYRRYLVIHVCDRFGQLASINIYHGLGLQQL